MKTDAEMLHFSITSSLSVDVVVLFLAPFFMNFSRISTTKVMGTCLSRATGIMLTGIMLTLKLSTVGIPVIAQMQ